MVMTVQCPDCQTEFPVDPAKVPEEGVRAQCSECPGIFPVFRPEAEALSFETLETVEFEEEVAPGDGADAEVFEAPDSFEIPAAEPEAELEAEPELAPEAELEAAPEAEAAGEGDFDSYFERTFEGDDLPQIGSDEGLPPATGDGIGTLEQSLEEVRQDFAEAAAEEPVVEEGAFTVEADSLEVTDLSGSFETETPVEPVAEAEPEPEPEAAPAAPAAPIQFGKRDPHEKAKRLARVLVSDMIVYHRDKHTQSLAAGTLKDDFADEVEKSIEEYVDQVGQEIHDTTEYFKEALNEILAKGQEVF